MGVTFLGGGTFFVPAKLIKFYTYFSLRLDWMDFEFYVVTLVRHQVCNMSKYRQIQEIFNQLNHVPINPEGYCEKGKEHTLFMNLFWQAMSIMHCVNDNGNLVKCYTFSLLDTFQSTNPGLVENSVSDILETFIRETWLKSSRLL